MTMIAHTQPAGRKRVRSACLVLACLAFVAASAPAVTPAGVSSMRAGQPQLLHVQQGDIGAGAAASAAAQATGGRVLNVKRTTAGGRVTYMVKVLIGGGTLRIVRVDGRTGQVR